MDVVTEPAIGLVTPNPGNGEDMPMADGRERMEDDDDEMQYYPDCVSEDEPNEHADAPTGSRVNNDQTMTDDDATPLDNAPLENSETEKNHIRLQLRELQEKYTELRQICEGLTTRLTTETPTAKNQWYTPGRTKKTLQANEFKASLPKKNRERLTKLDDRKSFVSMLRNS